MADDDKIVQEIELKGEQEVVDGFQRIGEAGEKAMEKVGEAAGSVSEPLGSITAASDKAGAGMTRLGVQTARTAEAIVAGSKSSDAMRLALGQQAAAAEVAATANLELDASQQKAGISARDFARTLSLFGRLTHTREITQFGRAVSVLSRGLQALAAPVAAVIIERIAASAAKASEETTKLAIETKLTTSEFNDIAAAGTAVGVSNEEFATGLKGIGKLLQEGADNERKFADETRAFSDKMAQASDKGFNLSKQLVDIGVHGVRTFRDLTNEQRRFEEGQRQFAEGLSDAGTDFSRSLRKLQEQRQDLFSGGPNAAVAFKRALRDNDEAEQDLLRKRSQALRKASEEQVRFAEEQVKLAEKASDEAKRNREEVARNIDAQVALEKSVRDARREFQLAGAEFEKNKTAIQRLGIANLDATGKLKQTPDALVEIADKLSKVPEGLDKIKIRSDLVAAGLDARLLPALEKGVKAFEELQKTGQNLRPGFDESQVANLRDFAVASDQAGAAFGRLKDDFAAAVAPAFIPFFRQITALFQQAAPSIKSFGETLANVLGPILTGIASIIDSVIAPAIRGLAELFQLIAQGINGLFDTNLSGADVFVLALVAIAGFLAPIPTLITAVVVIFGKLKEGLKDNQGALTAFGVAILALIAFFAPWTVAIGAVIAIIAILINKWPEIKAAAVAALGAVGQAFDQWRKAAEEAIDAVIEFFNPLISKIKETIQWFKDLFTAKAKTEGEQFGPPAPPGLRGGGHVRGRGTSTSDSILARLSTGEFVMRAAAVRKYGLRVMHTFNSMRAPVGAFARGGFVSRMSAPIGPIPRFAGGGMVGSRSAETPVNLFIGDQQFSLVAKEKETASSLTRYATRRRVKSAGRLPSYIGSGR